MIATVASSLPNDTALVLISSRHVADEAALPVDKHELDVLVGWGLLLGCTFGPVGPRRGDVAGSFVGCSRICWSVVTLSARIAIPRVVVCVPAVDFSVIRQAPRGKQVERRGDDDGWAQHRGWR